MQERQITSETPLSFLTYGDLIRVIEQAVEKLAKDTNVEEKKSIVRSIEELAIYLHCSKSTAQRYKNDFLYPAVHQEEGRKIFWMDTDEIDRLMKAEREAKTEQHF